MIISRVPDGERGAGEGRGIDAREDQDDHSHEYQTASELFELMAKNQNFDSNDIDTLTTRDLVFLYKNIDLGTNLMSNTNDLNVRSNQYVESVVYNEDSDSDISEINISEDIHNVVLINKERIDLLNNRTSLGNTLCHKFGDLEIESSELNSEYHKQFLFKDPYIKEQLRNLKLTNNCDEESILPASLLDYICCKRLEDNYNFYMDNIIRYVKHTIEQLKRISNGDYLTEKAKEKWREMENDFSDIKDSRDTKVLATSTSIPLHVERKFGGLVPTWDDIVHSEVDVRSLSKILEKKIIVEVPKLVCGSYKLLSKCGADNLIISCKKDQPSIEEINRGSTVDVVFKLQRSNSGRVISNISSIMILQAMATASDRLATESNKLEAPNHKNNILEVTNQNNILDVSAHNYMIEMPTDNNLLENNVKIVELDSNDDDNDQKSELRVTKKESAFKLSHSDNVVNEDSYMDTIDYLYSDNLPTARVEQSNQDSTSFGLKHIFDKQNEASFKLVSPDELRITMHRLNMQVTLPEESGDDIMSLTTNSKRKSSTKVRIKSPYENKSYLIEEKKRRRLLEIRERREKKKIALAENCKITKHKYGMMPQHSSSVTRLSITNKSFYNSIYGQTANLDHKPLKGRNRKSMKRESVEELECDEIETVSECPILSPDENNRKFTDRCYFLDDTVTEIMYMDMKKTENKDIKEVFSPSTSEVSNDFRTNINLLSQLIGSETDINSTNLEVTSNVEAPRLEEISCIDDRNDKIQDVIGAQSISNIAPSNTPTEDGNVMKEEPKKTLSVVECRKSIDKIYELLNKLGKPEIIESKPTKINLGTTNVEKIVVIGGKGSSTIQGSDSGTSVKHHLTSSNPSCYSFGKHANTESKLHKIHDKIVLTPLTTVVPKVIISSKSQNSQIVSESNRKERKKKNTFLTDNVPDSPLKAISQLLHEFENVKKNRQKSAAEHKSSKKPDSAVVADNKSAIRQNPIKRHSRLEQHLRDNTMTQLDKYPKTAASRDKKLKPPTVIEVVKNLHNNQENKHVDKISKKKVNDLMDEVKEARGEAVRGPSKFNSRLNTLAQPKRSYVLAHSEEYQYKYGRNLMADRLQRLAAGGPHPVVDKNRGATILKNRGKRSEPESTVSVKPQSSPMPPLERTVRFRRSANNSPCKKEAKSPERGPFTKQNNMLETPETLKKKMVAVETYVNNHYGRSTSPLVAGAPRSVQISRVPLLPTDLELDSTASSVSPNEESSSLGSKLHRIIDTMINKPPGLDVVTECRESNSKASKDEADNYFPTDNLSRSVEQNLSTDSEYNVDIFEDKNVLTAVENIEKFSNSVDHSSQEMEDSAASDFHVSSSVSQLEKLENALFQRMSVGTFQKRLRLKNLTLTPKHSMQQVVLLQSGDAATSSLVIKSTMSQNFTIKSETETLPHFKSLPVFSKSHVDWRFANLPLQVTTVGYAFPQYKSIQADFNPTCLLKDMSAKSTDAMSHLIMFDKDSQCYKGEHIQSGIQQDAQTADQVSKMIVSTDVDPHKPTVMTRSEDYNTDKTSPHKEQTKNFKAFPDITESVKFSDDTNVQNHVTTVKQISETVQTEDQCKIQIDTEEINKPSGGATTLVTAVDASKNIDTTSCESIDYTTSLDILVGLLNEIKKITTCQTQITNDTESNDLEVILNTAAALEDAVCRPRDVVSLTSLDKLRELESNRNLYSLHITNDCEDDKYKKVLLKSEIPPHKMDTVVCPETEIVYVDKKVGFDIAERVLVNTLTDVPSRFLPVPVSQSTNVTNSLIGVLSVPSTQSLISFTEYHTYSMQPVKDVVELSQVNEGRLQSPRNPSPVFENNNNSKADKALHYNKLVRIEKVEMSQPNLKIKGKSYMPTEIDPIMKMKRDILVTVYSILVFTVFAAMSFPRILLSDV